MRDQLQRVVQLAKDITGIGICYMRDSEILFTRSRKFEVVLVRACVINVMLRQCKVSMRQLGFAMGMDHTSIYHHREAHYTRYKYEDDYFDLYNKLAKAMKEHDPYYINVEEVVSLINEIM